MGTVGSKGSGIGGLFPLEVEKWISFLKRDLKNFFFVFKKDLKIRAVLRCPGRRSGAAAGSVSAR
jgi:hypothetical protein